MTAIKKIPEIPTQEKGGKTVKNMKSKDFLEAQILSIKSLFFEVFSLDMGHQDSYKNTINQQRILLKQST